MNLNPIQWVTDGIASVVSSYQTSKQARVEAKTAVAGKKIDYKLAKWEAKIDMLKSRAQHDADYDMQVLKNRRFTWLDEVLGISIILMTLLAFVPGVAPYIKEGWVAVSQAPFWFQFAWYTLIASTLGGLTVLRVLLGMKKRGASLPQDQRATYPESHPNTSRVPPQPASETPQKGQDGSQPPERTDPQEESEEDPPSRNHEDREPREQPESQYRPSRNPRGGR